MTPVEWLEQDYIWIMKPYPLGQEAMDGISGLTVFCVEGPKDGGNCKGPMFSLKRDDAEYDELYSSNRNWDAPLRVIPLDSPAENHPEFV